MKTILITVPDDWVKGDCYICKSVGGVNPACNAKEAVEVSTGNNMSGVLPRHEGQKEHYYENGRYGSGKPVKLYAVAVDK